MVFFPSTVRFGKVYEWTDAPPGAVGEIYVDQEVPTNRITVTVPNANVFFARAPGRYMMDIKIEKEGYLTLTGEFEHDGGGDKHRITIFLVKDT